MNQSLHRGQWVILLLLLLSSTLMGGCSSPTFITKKYDATYQVRTNKLKLILVRGHFPSIEAALKEGGLNQLEWYGDVAKQMEKNFQHNGVTLSARAVDTIKGSDIQSETAAEGTPVLMIYPKSINQLSDGGVHYTMRAILFAPGKATPVWDAETIVWPDQAANDLSLKTLNELARLNLVVMNSKDAETVDGMRKSTFGGVLTK
jgi:hypothetical protein